MSSKFCKLLCQDPSLIEDEQIRSEVFAVRRLEKRMLASSKQEKEMSKDLRDKELTRANLQGLPEIQAHAIKSAQPAEKDTEETADSSENESLSCTQKNSHETQHQAPSSKKRKTAMVQSLSRRLPTRWVNPPKKRLRQRERRVVRLAQSYLKTKQNIIISSPKKFQSFSNSWE